MSRAFLKKLKDIKDPEKFLHFFKIILLRIKVFLTDFLTWKFSQSC